MEYHPMQRFLPEPNFDPITIALVVGAAGTVVSGFGKANAQETAGKQRQLELEAQAAGQKFDAEVAERDAIEAKGQGEKNIEDFIRENSARAASSRAKEGGKGLLFGIEHQVFDEQRIEEGVRTIGGNTRRNVAAAQNRAVINRFNAKTNIASGKRINKAAKTSATATRIGSILSAAGGMGGSSMASGTPTFTTTSVPAGQPEPVSYASH